ncbi:MAG: hypothetical protein AAFQ89_10440, partial [Cyanobacteria bacterium J06626_18]
MNSSQHENNRRPKQGRIALITALLQESMPNGSMHGLPKIASGKDWRFDFLGAVGQGLNARQINIFQQNPVGESKLLVSINLDTGKIVFASSLSLEESKGLLQELTDALTGKKAQLSPKWRGINIAKIDLESNTKPLLKTNQQGIIIFIGALEDQDESIEEDASERRLLANMNLKMSKKSKLPVNQLPSTVSGSDSEIVDLSPQMQLAFIRRLNQLVKLLNCQQYNSQFDTFSPQKVGQQTLNDLSITLHHIASKVARQNSQPRGLTVKKTQCSDSRDPSLYLNVMAIQISQVARLVANMRTLQNG